MAKFKDVICCIKNGGTAWRMSWAEEGDKEIMMQIPQCISKDIVPKMTSVQESIKPKISTVGSGEIEYHDQVIIITFTDDGKTPARGRSRIPWRRIRQDIVAKCDFHCQGKRMQCRHPRLGHQGIYKMGVRLVHPQRI